MPPATPTCRCAVQVCTALLFAIAWACPARCEEPAIGVLVLRNGNVLEGVVRRSDGVYVVENGGASLQVPADQVEMACTSLVQAYERRRQERVGAAADAHLELASWCVRNRLLDQAAREVLDARMRDPGHPRIETIELQIRQALEIEAARRARAEQEQTAQRAQVTATIKPAPQTPAINVSLEAQTQFVRSIQPMLVQSCAVGGCHQPGATQRLQLDRWALEGNGNPELIRKNLESVLAQIDAADPASSPLLLHARRTHGVARAGQSKPLSTYQSAMLLDWLNMAAGVTPAAHEQDAVPADQSPQPPAEPLLEEDAAPAPPSAPPETEAFKPRDAFDPEIFNRQVAAEAQRRETASTAALSAETNAELDAIGDAVEAAVATAPAAE